MGKPPSKKEGQQDQATKKKKGECVKRSNPFHILKKSWSCPCLHAEVSKISLILGSLCGKKIYPIMD